MTGSESIVIAVDVMRPLHIVDGFGVGEPIVVIEVPLAQP